MNVIIILIGISIVLAVLFLTAFVLAIKSGQFDDNHSPSIRILLDEKQNKNTSN
ncbi:MAG: cbb3-type cytochrome oxidase assembly protein CcoS [Cytophagales bacterium]|nr:cbb3-type cytochrome oxidase assembly protein CcoS [Cytophagales bacterium]